MQRLLIGKRSLDARVYTCSRCGYHIAMLKGEIAVLCARCRKKGAWVPTAHKIFLQTKNAVREIHKKSSWQDMISDKITSWCGSLNFAYFHIILFTGWLTYNTQGRPFDPYPFGLLTTFVSLEAILLSTFVLMSQRRAGESSNLRSELDYHVNLKSERMITEVKAMLADLARPSRKERRRGKVHVREVI